MLLILEINASGHNPIATWADPKGGPPRTVAEEVIKQLARYANAHCQKDFAAHLQVCLPLLVTMRALPPQTCEMFQHIEFPNCCRWITGNITRFITAKSSIKTILLRVASTPCMLAAHCAKAASRS